MAEAITEVIRKRFSSRTYLEEPIIEDKQQKLAEFLAASQIGPLGTRMRFQLVAASEDDGQALKGLGTYGSIRRATGFIVGAVEEGPKGLEDFGYLMEQAILLATSMGLGTCWLGGAFNKSNFGKKISLTAQEVLPAVAAIGNIADRNLSGDEIRQRVGATQRYASDQLFFDQEFGQAMTPDAAGVYAELLEMVRLAPSAKNKQPWRIIRKGQRWHFYLERTKGYGKGSLIFRLLGVADLQRIDMGIAMCHFELAAQELGVLGNWVVEETEIDGLGHKLEYTASWVPATGI